jgi:hypothetical protein
MIEQIIAKMGMFERMAINVAGLSLRATKETNTS